MPTMPAILGPARLGNFRLGYQPAALAAVRATRVRILLDGVSARTRVSGLQIRDILNESPSTCSLVFDGTESPVDGQDLRITINSDAPRLLFSGTLQTTDQIYEGTPAHVAWPCHGIDYTARLNYRRPFGTWTNVSATTIAQYLVMTFAPTFTTTHIEAGLPTVSITFDGSEECIACFARLATLIGGYCKVEDLDAWLFLTDTSDPPAAVDVTTPPEHDPPIRCTIDDSQLRTRVYGKGHGEPVPVDVPAGETIVPIVDASMFNPAGGEAMAGVTPDGAQSQKLAYTGVILGGVGTIVGTGATPSVAPSVTLVVGSGLGTGIYQYAYTSVTPSGESLPSPLATITTGGVFPGAATFNSFVPGLGVGGLTVGSTYEYGWTWSYRVTLGDHSDETPLGATVSVVAQAAGGGGSDFHKINTAYSADPLVFFVYLYRRLAAGAWHYIGHRANNDAVTPYWNDGASDASVAGNPAPSNTRPAGNQVAVSAIAIGASPTTSRKVYRTVVNGAQLKLHTTIPNNTATTIATDIIADGSLGANAPITDTSGLTQPYGQVNAGSTTIVTAGTGSLASAGWLITVSGELIRYTGISGNTLTGIPATGVGSILTTIFYDDPLVPAPALTGVTGVVLAMQKGSPVHLWVQRDDVAAQAAAAARETTATFTSDGIHEYTITDARRGEASLIARCQAELVLYANPIVTYTYATRDVKTKSGKSVHINLPGYPVGDYVIQDVTIDQIDVAPGLAPRFQVTASSVAFSLEAVLRNLIGQAA